MQTTDQTSQVFRAVSDPTRRRILDLLEVRDRSVGELVEHCDLSQSAVSQHLKVLRDAQLARSRAVGRQRLYCINAAPLEEAQRWLRRFERFWDDKLASLGTYLDEQADGEASE